jgi:hypothetical protein
LENPVIGRVLFFGKEPAVFSLFLYFCRINECKMISQSELIDLLQDIESARVEMDNRISFVA